ncbi:hypothetical protein AGRA3207_000966 [Actinomadura graeca]|uniref:IclR-ED domain-containing protein n=1 Tax=Actinomadura graeca TaxID=2750812 RepID=A0ABX8QNL0_9ACTN|nr:hypothetical protein [Actinomadura graeca]QXJ20282.1 hypothetical protein AGRA3207_000966 [Actinomadura graeca]
MACRPISEESLGKALLERIAYGYRLDGGLFELSMRASPERFLIEVSAPYLHELLERTHETVHLGVLRDLEVVYLTKIDGWRRAAAPSRTGGRIAIQLSATVAKSNDTQPLS